MYTILYVMKTIGGTIESLKDISALLTNYKNYLNSLQNYSAVNRNLATNTLLKKYSFIAGDQRIPQS